MEYVHQCAMGYGMPKMNNGMYYSVQVAVLQMALHIDIPSGVVVSRFVVVSAAVIIIIVMIAIEVENIILVIRTL